MCSRSHNWIAALCLALCTACDKPIAHTHSRVLRVCADPNNLPFSNRAEEGFENRIANVVARDLNATIAYTWFAQRRGFIRNTLKAGACDVVIGVPAGYEMVETTQPYYRSTYVFLTRDDGSPAPQSLDDPLLKQAAIGVHIIGDDYSNPPPVHALGKRGIVHNVSGFTIYGDYSEPNPPARLIEAVADRKVDVAIVWGPFAGYFAPLQKTNLKITQVTPDNDGPSLPLVYSIAMGVRKGDQKLRDELQTVLDRRQAEIRGILQQFGVPLRALQ